jgi:Flp pilus assembly protein TadD
VARQSLIVAGAAIAAWLIAGLLITRTGAARLPAMPDRALLTTAVADQIAAADSAARTNPTSAAVVGELGIVYHASLRPVEAQQAYALAEALDSENWRWAYYRGLLFEEHGDQAAALDAFARVAARAPGYGLVHFHIAEIQFKLVHLDEAAAAYGAARDARPESADGEAAAGRPARRGLPLSDHASFGLARIAQANPAARTRAYSPPVDPLLDNVVARSLHTDLLLKHAALAARAGDTAWREWLTRRALSANPRGFDVLLEMSSMLQAAGKHTEALSFLQQCEEVAPGDHHTLVAQGKSLTELGRLDEAERVLRRAVRVRDAAAEYNLGNVLDRMDRWDEARAHYEQALAIDPFHARAMNNLAIGLDQRGQTADAIRLFNRALQAAPDNAEFSSNLGTALMGAGRLDEALTVLDAAIGLDATFANAHNNRGIALARLQRLGEARQSFEKALQLDPGHSDARRNLAAITSK